jgi:hypothetical protein
VQVASISSRDVGNTQLVSQNFLNIIRGKVQIVGGCHQIKYMLARSMPPFQVRGDKAEDIRNGMNTIDSAAEVYQGGSAQEKIVGDVEDPSGLKESSAVSAPIEKSLIDFDWSPPANVSVCKLRSRQRFVQ